MATINQNPEQLTRDVIDSTLERSGWIIQNKKQCNLAAGVGVAIREFQTGAGAAESILFVNQKPVGLIEAKWEEEGDNCQIGFTATPDNGIFAVDEKVKKPRFSNPYCEAIKIFLN